MAHSLAHSAARNSLRDKLIRALEGACVAFGRIVLIGEDIEKFRVEALKSTGEIMSPSDLDEVVKQYFYAVFNEQLSDSHSMLNLAGQVDQDELIRAATATVDFLASLPATYEITFPLPNFPTVDNDIRLNSRVSISSRFTPSSFVHGPASKSPGASIKILARGYVKTGRQQSAFREAMSLLKVVVRIGQLSGVFRRTRSNKPLAISEIITGNRSEIIYSAGVQLSLRVSNKKPTPIRLDVGLSKLLDELIAPNGLESKEFFKALAHTQFLAELMYQPAAEENVLSIRQALEWSFDAGVEEDETMRFIKTCIGLEAVLADQSEGLGITEKLADRCAFLLCRTPAERKEKRALVRDIYQLRSKIVHGNASGLKQQELKLAEEAQHTLAEIFSVELRALQSWAAKQEQLSTLMDIGLRNSEQANSLSPS